MEKPSPSELEDEVAALRKIFETMTSLVPRAQPEQPTCSSCKWSRIVASPDAGKVLRCINLRVMATYGKNQNFFQSLVAEDAWRCRFFAQPETGDSTD